MPNLKIHIPREVLAQLRAGKSLTLTLDSGKSAAGTAGGRRKKTTTRRGGRVRTSKRRPGRPGKGGGAPLHEQILTWAGKGKEFGPLDVMKRFKVKRSHAGMLISRLMKDKSIKRSGRGVYHT